MLSALKNVKLYSYKDLRIATENFDLANKIGEGGFGSVYKVNFLRRKFDHICVDCGHHHALLSKKLFLDFPLFRPKLLITQAKLKDGTLAAIKVLSAESRQGVPEFLTEINVIANIEHENLVKLYGCCVEENHRILVYGYLENNSLAQAFIGNCLCPLRLIPFNI